MSCLFWERYDLLQVCHGVLLNHLGQGSSTFFSPRTPWLRETLSRDPHRPKFKPDIHIFYLLLSVSHTHTNTLPYTCLNIMIHNLIHTTRFDCFCLLFYYF